MRNEESLLYVRRASRSQIATSLIVAGLLFAAFLGTLPYTAVPFRRYNAFIPALDTALMMADLVTAAILFSQASALRSRPFALLGAGYLFSGLIIVAHALSFPGAFTPEGLIGGGTSTTAWLYFFGHLGLPVATIAYALVKRGSAARPLASHTMNRVLASNLAVPVLLACILILITTEGHDLLPMAMRDPVQFASTSLYMGAFLLGLFAISLAVLAWGHKSLIDIWLMVALWAWLLEMALITTLPERYTLGWYSGRFASLFASLFVLLALLIESSRLYMQQSLSAASEQQQREGRLMSLDVAASAIAHEVKQPITAMVTNASAALIRARQDQPDLAKVMHSLELIVEDGHRASDVIGSIRALFGQHEATVTPVDLNALLGETMDLRSVEIANHAIMTTRDLDPDLPMLPVQRLQMRQVFVNLLNNAIEALADRPGGSRRISISTATTDSGDVAIEISDTGRGIAPEQTDRIFDAFYTTKSYGTGVGLPLCRSIIEEHGGKLLVSSKEGQGTAFRIVLPSQQD